jgi:uncharacterized protein YaaQ
MKLVISIVRDQDAGRVIDGLVAKDYRATRINTAGGFLKRGNATVLVGVNDEQVDEVVETVKSICHEGRSADGLGILFVLPVAATYKA